ncbi:MAG: hypothetical protein QQN41_02480 [Nitrosopumilus sp.]
MSKKRIDETRLKSIFIISFGLIPVIVALFVLKNTFGLNQKLFILLFNVGIAIISVGVIAFIWDIIGGDPISNALRFFKKAESLKSIGLEDIVIREGKKNIFAEVYEQIRSAKKVDMMGLVLWRDWFHEEQFRNTLTDVLNQDEKIRIRILLLKPLDHESSIILSQRALDENIAKSIDKKEGTIDFDRLEKIASKNADRMNIDINFTLNEIHKIINDKNRGRLEVRLVDKTYINCSLFRIDNQILVVDYLHRTGGSGTPVKEIRGSKTRLFKIYCEEFETVWSISKKWDNKKYLD